jgi:hypothetical protein
VEKRYVESILVSCCQLFFSSFDTANVATLSIATDVKGEITLSSVSEFSVSTCLCCSTSARVAFCFEPLLPHRLFPLEIFVRRRIKVGGSSSIGTLSDDSSPIVDDSFHDSSSDSFEESSSDISAYYAVVWCVVGGTTFGWLPGAGQYSSFEISFW